MFKEKRIERERERVSEEKKKRDWRGEGRGE